MAEIYAAPKSIEKPSFSIFSDTSIPAKDRLAKYREAEENYIQQVRDLLKANGYTGKNAGEIIKFPVADSHAMYMVASMKPLKLMHMPLGDEWTFQYDYLLTAKEVQQKVDQQKSLEKLFSQKGK